MPRNGAVGHCSGREGRYDFVSPEHRGIAEGGPAPPFCSQSVAQRLYQRKTHGKNTTLFEIRVYYRRNVLIRPHAKSSVSWSPVAPLVVPFPTWLGNLPPPSPRKLRFCRRELHGALAIHGRNHRPSG